MKNLIYHIGYVILLLLVGCVGVLSLIYTAIQIPTSENISDSILFIICFVLLIAFTSFQVYSVIRTFKHEGVFLKGLLYGSDNVFALKTYIFINILIALGITFIVYGSLLFFDFNIPLNTFPHELDLLIITFGLLIITNGLFVSLYPLVKDYDKER